MKPLLLKNKKVVMVAALLMVCALLAGLRWYFTYSSARSTQLSRQQEKNKKAANAIPAVRAFTAKKVTFVDKLVMTGTLQGGARVELRFNREGRIEKIHHRVGDKVKKGAVIAALEVGEARLKKQQAEAELSQAVDLYRSGAIAKPKLTQARLAAQLARKEFQRSYLKAPRNGSIGELNSEVGEFVSTQMTVATLVSVGKVFVEMGVIEKDLSKLHLNQTVQVKVETYPDVIFKGKIARIAPLVEGTSRTRTVRAEIDNKEGLLLPGMFAQCEIFIQEKPDALIVPATAIRDGQVFSIQKNNQIKAIPIKVGYESADYSEVASGLPDNTKIVENLSNPIRPGIKVDVIEEVAYEPR